MTVLYDARKIKVFEALISLCEYTHESENWANALWRDFMLSEDIYKEFVYYLEHNDFLDLYQISGYTIIDMFIYEMNRYNMLQDLEKNDIRRDKETMVLHAFYHLLQMEKDPVQYKKKMQSDQGMDKHYN